MIARLLISPSLKIRVSEINKILSEGNFSFNHPDLLYFPNDSKLGIEQSRLINKHFLLKPYQLKGKVVVLEDASSLTIEAQNALLKILEEPPEDAVLILGAKSESDLLPTVISRCQIVILEGAQLFESEPQGLIPQSRRRQIESDSKDAIASFTLSETNVLQHDIEELLNSTVEERFEYIGNLKEKEEFLQYMVSYFRSLMHQKITMRSTTVTQDVTNQQLKDFIKELIHAEEWAAQNVNIRAILEYLMLVMPKAKE